MTKSEFDAYRQRIYEQGASIVNAYDRATSDAQRQTQLSSLIALMEGFQATYLSVRCPPGQNLCPGLIEASWIDPRFHDYYDFFQKIIQTWQARLGTTTTNAPGTSGTTLTSTSGCEAGICGPVPPSTPLTSVVSGAPGSGGQSSIVTSGGGVTVSQDSLPILQGGLSPSPFVNDLPGSLTPTALTESGAIAPVVQTTPGGGTFNFKDYATGPFGWALLAIGGLIVLLKYGTKAKGA